MTSTYWSSFKMNLVDTSPEYSIFKTLRPTVSFSTLVTFKFLISLNLRSPLKSNLGTQILMPQSSTYPMIPLLTTSFLRRNRQVKIFSQPLDTLFACSFFSLQRSVSSFGMTLKFFFPSRIEANCLCTNISGYLLIGEVK